MKKKATTTGTKTQVLSILVVDIVGSTRLYEVRGNLEAKQMIASCLEPLADIVAKHDGVVVKSLGDSLLCTFEDRQDSVWAAVAMCDELTRNELNGRVGVDHGEVVVGGSDIFGDVVRTASRIVDSANPGEILITRTLRDSLPPFMQDIMREVQPVAVKGYRKPIKVYAILKSGGSESSDDLTQTIYFTREESGIVPADGHIVLRYQGKELILAPGEDLTVGRERGSGLLVSSKHASRLHARVIFRGGQFRIEDKSSNGTYLVPDHQPQVRLDREAAILFGSGQIYLGADPDKVGSDPIRYEVVPPAKK